MASLFPSLPVFMDLIGRRVVICSGDRYAATFARNSLEAGAGVVAIDPAPCPEFAALGASVRLELRRWRAADFKDAALVAGGAHERRPGPLRRAVKNARAIFLALDGGPDADVAIGATASRGPLTIGIATAGLPSPLAAAIAGRIEAAAPPGLTAFLEAAARCGTPPPGDSRGQAKFWEAALAAAAKAAAGRSAPTDWDVWLADRLASGRNAE
jgi:uroporphyrin-III C-methyltransferase/precorrin-2 dehydrogenase/sirohydrochlorin ferrochelatase